MNTWHAGISAAAKSSADVCLLQETRIDDTEACLRAEDAARGEAWASESSKAIATQDGGA